MKKTTKKLALNKETIKQLPSTALDQIAGAKRRHNTDACPTALNTCGCRHTDACPSALNTGCC